jgi:hypothetical protein
MKMMKKTSIALAVAAALGVLPPHAFAIVKIMSDDATKALDPVPAGAAIGGPVRFAIEESGESTLTLKSFYDSADDYFEGDLTAAIPVPSSYTVDSTKTLSIKIVLTGGATFANDPVLACPNSGFTTLAVGATVVSAGAGSTAIAEASGLIIKPTSGGSVVSVTSKATATFNISPGLTTHTFTNLGADTTAAYCFLTFTPSTVANSGIAAYKVGNRGEVSINVETTYIQANQSTKSTTAGTLLKFVTAIKGIIGAETVNDAAGYPSVTIDVKQASKKFAEYAGPPKTTTTVAPLGGIVIDSATTASLLRISNNTAGAVAANWGLIMASGSVTINGPLMAGVKEVNLYDGTSTACAGAPSVGLKGTPSTTTGGGGAVTIAGIPVADLQGGLNICATVDGSKVLNAGQLTAVLTATGADGFVLDLGTEQDITKVEINGARLRVLNIPASNSPELGFVRFYNTSSQDVEVTGTLYGMDGKVIGTENSVLFSALKANDVEVLKASDLEKKIGASGPWTGRAWLLVQAQVDKESFRVQALIRTPGVGGALINMSTDATN